MDSTIKTVDQSPRQGTFLMITAAYPHIVATDISLTGHHDYGCFVDKLRFWVDAFQIFDLLKSFLLLPWLLAEVQKLLEKLIITDKLCFLG